MLISYLTDVSYRLSLINLDRKKHRDVKTESVIHGKMIIEGLPFEKCGLWPFAEKEEREYAEFIIGVDSDEKPISFTSDPEKLRNLFGKNPNAPLYQTPVFFKKTVLGKYISEPTKYQVVDGHLWCDGFWGMRLDNNHTDYMIAMLGDLGRDLPEKEQTHWKHHNVAPDGTYSVIPHLAAGSTENGQILKTALCSSGSLLTILCQRGRCISIGSYLCHYRMLIYITFLHCAAL